MAHPEGQSLPGDESEPPLGNAQDLPNNEPPLRRPTDAMSPKFGFSHAPMSRTRMMLYGALGSAAMLGTHLSNQETHRLNQAGMTTTSMSPLLRELDSMTHEERRMLNMLEDIEDLTMSEDDLQNVSLQHRAMDAKHRAFIAVLSKAPGHDPEAACRILEEAGCGCVTPEAIEAVRHVFKHIEGREDEHLQALADAVSTAQMIKVCSEYNKAPGTKKEKQAAAGVLLDQVKAFLVKQSQGPQRNPEEIEQRKKAKNGIDQIVNRPRFLPITSMAMMTEKKLEAALKEGLQTAAKKIKTSGGADIHHDHLHQAAHVITWLIEHGKVKAPETMMAKASITPSQEVEIGIDEEE